MGVEKFEVPDWSQYKVEDAPRLQILEKRLASHGLKDPWIRNEVWRYHKKNWNPVMVNLRSSALCGFKYAFAAMVVTVLAEKLLSKYSPKKDEAHH
ncbi:NADH dehydrogenase [ubiquinone] 1 beta subcomplex subunit 3 [Octopus bimaculoides]|uniref:NADH dehydrogenase [ubiquinone] 1 beta subcomplex subunit 3 n=1 Tax=Octopus bimaculoides TaxID=37653 RepID=A0A0L8GM41_OCTBM|nr:NADH dehydrogenase [ubiquinone] 1 beta subcomplex subunit 3 [Octopus bimaculoides]|eukprot:XP_014779736.1 PREDICTED: NADH dehydrogenase [ubiquinone] 1 beta subcomplex subunit 3-like [Octopus bimaculoides]